MGEFGAFKNYQKTLPDAVAAMSRHLDSVYDLGFIGYMYWTYDCDEQERLWNAMSDQAQILQALPK